MTVSGSSIASPQRHPWVERFMGDPAVEYRNFIEGHADIPPFGRADTPDAAVQIFGALPADDPALPALGKAAMDWLRGQRKVRLPGRSGPRRRMIRQVAESFEIIARLKLREAAESCFDQRFALGNWLTAFVDDPSRDARFEFYRTLARVQPIIAGTRDVGALAPIWQDICARSGTALPDYYLEVGLLGLRLRPKAETESDVAGWIAGLANWAVAQDPGPEAFYREWRYLKRLHPRTPKSWRREVKRLMAQARFREADVPLLDWWARDDDLKPLLRENAKHAAPDRSPMPDECGRLIANMGEAGFDATAADIRDFVRRHEVFADATGITEHLLAAFHQLGQALIKTGETSAVDLAEELARISLRWKPTDAHSWAFWADALEAKGAAGAAELVRREHLRRLPFNIDAHTQLAEFLIADDRAPEARALLAEAAAAGLSDDVTRAIEVRLAAHLDGPEAAHAVLQAALDQNSDTPLLLEFSTLMNEGRPIRLPSWRYQTKPLVRNFENALHDPAIMTLERFRDMTRLSEQLAQPAMHDPAVAEIRRTLSEEPEFAYAHVLAARAGIWEAESKALADLPAAFERALQQQDRETLEHIAARAPRLAALTLVARALFGDERASSEIEAWLAEDDGAFDGADEGLRDWLRQEAKKAGQLVDIADFLHRRRDTVSRALQRANEAKIGDDLLVA